MSYTQQAQPQAKWEKNNGHKHHKLPKIKNVHTENYLIEYLNSKVIHDRKGNGYQRQMKRKNTLENMRLRKKLSQIKARKNQFDLYSDSELQGQLFSLKLASKKAYRQLKAKDLQQQNDIMVQRIVRIKSHHSPLLPLQISMSKSRLHNRGQSMMLPSLV